MTKSKLVPMLLTQGFFEEFKYKTCLSYFTLLLWMESKLVTTSASRVNRRVWNPTCSAMLSFITIFAIWSSSCASEVMVVVAVATFSTLRLHMRRSSSQSAMPSLLHGASRKPAGGAGGWMPNSSLTGHEGSVYLSITGKHFTCSVGLLLPKLSKKDSHHFGHVDVNVNRKFSIRVVEIINIIDLGYKWIYHSEPNKYHIHQKEKLVNFQTQITQRYCLTIIPPHRGEWNAFEATFLFLWSWMWSGEWWASGTYSRKLSTGLEEAAFEPGIESYTTIRSEHINSARWILTLTQACRHDDIYRLDDIKSLILSSIPCIMKHTVFYFTGELLKHIQPLYSVANLTAIVNKSGYFPTPLSDFFLYLP